MTKEQIQEFKRMCNEKGIEEYYILIDGMNDDKFARCLNMREVKKEFRKYHNECDGDFEPILIKYNRKTKNGCYITDFTY